MAKKKILFLICLISIYYLAWHVQNNLLFNSDVSWLMLATKRLLAGGSYTNDFFEINPPMILYLYVPPVLLANFFHFSNMIAMKIFIYFIATISLMMCYFFTEEIFVEKEMRAIFILMLAAVFLLFPLNEFGQREHLMMMLCMPYFLRSAGMTSVVGILAGLGFAIKPYFLIPFLLIELYLFSFRRIEFIIILLIITTYLMTIFLFHFDYVRDVIPIVKNYYQTYHTPWKIILFNEPACFAYFTLLFYGIRRHYLASREFYFILFLALIGFLFAYFAQQSLWYYHALPVFSFSILLSVLLLAQLINQQSISRKEYFTLTLFSLSLFLYLFLKLNYLWFWHAPLFLSAILLFLLALLFLLPRHKTISTFLGLMLFAYPAYQLGNIYTTAIYYKNLFSGFLDAMKPYENKSIYFFSNAAEFAFPGTEYTHQTFTERFACIGLFSERNKNFYINAINEDIQRYQPEFIFVDTRHKNEKTKLGYFGNDQINYVKIFSENNAFKKTWGSYRYLISIDGQPLYKFDIFKKINKMQIADRDSR